MEELEIIDKTDSPSGKSELLEPNVSESKKDGKKEMSEEEKKDQPPAEEEKKTEETPKEEEKKEASPAEENKDMTDKTEELSFEKLSERIATLSKEELIDIFGKAIEALKALMAPAEPKTPQDVKSQMMSEISKRDKQLELQETRIKELEKLFKVGEKKTREDLTEAPKKKESLSNTVMNRDGSITSKDW